MSEKWGGKFSLTHNGPYKSDLNINQKADGKHITFPISMKNYRI
jgi:hypothetical protein